MESILREKSSVIFTHGAASRSINAKCGSLKSIHFPQQKYSPVFYHINSLRFPAPSRDWLTLGIIATRLTPRAATRKFLKLNLGSDLAEGECRLSRLCLTILTSMKNDVVTQKAHNSALKLKNLDRQLQGSLLIKHLIWQL